VRSNDAVSLSQGKVPFASHGILTKGEGFPPIDDYVGPPYYANVSLRQAAQLFAMA
jgi:hypothetical protein